MIDRPHFAYPFQRGTNGRVNVVEQDTVEHVNSCCNLILRCPFGFRDDRPEFGWPFPEFVNIPVDTKALTDALQEFEPRASYRIEEYRSMAEAAVREVSIDAQVEV